VKQTDMQNNWVEENQKYLSTQINYIKKILEENILSKKKRRLY